MVTGSDGRVQGFQEKPDPAEALSDLANCMIYVLEPEIFDYFPDKPEVDFALEVFPALLDHDVPFFVHVADAYWNDVGSLPEFLAGNLDVLTGAVAVEPAGELVDADAGGSDRGRGRGHGSGADRRRGSGRCGGANRRAGRARSRLSGRGGSPGQGIGAPGGCRGSRRGPARRFDPGPPRRARNLRGMEVEFLWWEACPSWERALAELREEMSGLGLDPQAIELREVSTEADAEHEGFVGSPTIRVDGMDIASARRRAGGANLPRLQAARRTHLRASRPRGRAPGARGGDRRRRR